MVYIGAALVYTYPLARHFSTNILGYFFGDPNDFLWNFWWTKVALIHLGKSPLYTDYIFYPFGASLVYHSYPLVKSFLSVPLQLICGLIPTYNLLLLSTFVLAGYGTFQLVYYLVGDRRAALVAGLVFAFCPYRSLKIFYVSLSSSEWIPWYVLFLLKSQRERSSIRAIGAGVFLSLCLLDSRYHFISLGLFSGIYLIYCGFASTDGKHLWMKGILYLGTGFIVSSAPFLYLLVRNVGKTNTVSLQYSVLQSADLLSLLAPAWTMMAHPFYSLWAKSYARMGFDLSAFIGYGVLVSLVVSFFFLRKRVCSLKFWGWVLFIFFVLSLGPYLKINGHTNYTLGGLSFKIPLPYLLLRHIPVLTLVRSPERLGIMVMLSASVILGYSLHRLIVSVHSIGAHPMFHNIVLPIAAGGLLCFEYFSIPFPIQGKAYVPSVYRYLARDQKSYTLLEMPISIGTSEMEIYPYDANVLFFQTVHQKRIFSGLVSYLASKELRYFQYTPIFSTLLRLQAGEELSSFLIRERAVAKELVSLLDIRYVIIRLYPSIPIFGPGIDLDRASRIDRYIQEVFPAERLWEQADAAYLEQFEGIHQEIHQAYVASDWKVFLEKVYESLSMNPIYKAYRIQRDGEKETTELNFGTPSARVHLVYGWSENESDGSVTFVWADADTSLLLLRLEGQQDRKLSAQVRPFTFPGSPSQRMWIEVNGRVVSEIELTTSEGMWQDVECVVPASYWRQGVNRVAFLFSYAQSPFEVGMGEDRRTLAVAFQELEIAPVASKAVFH